MEDELRAAPSSYRSAMSTKLRMYRRDLGKLQRDIKLSAPGFGSSYQPVEGSHHGLYSSENQHSVSVELWTYTYVSWHSQCERDKQDTRLRNVARLISCIVLDLGIPHRKSLWVRVAQKHLHNDLSFVLFTWIMPTRHISSAVTRESNNVADVSPV